MATAAGVSATDLATDATCHIVAARHGERLDYVVRDSGSNWLTLPSTDRPWDPPLTDAGREQAVGLGRRVRRSLAERGLPPVTAVYASPLIRCCQTAAGAVKGLTDGERGKRAGESDGSPGKEKKTNGGARRDPLLIRVEHGLVECLNEKWYRSWSLQGSDGTWGYCPSKQGNDGESEVSPWYVDEETLHSKSKVPVQELLRLARDVENRLKVDGEEGGIDEAYTTPCHPITEPYCWGNFESRQVQKQRMQTVASKLADRHPGESVLLVSHGGPVTHLYEMLTGNNWTVHGVSGYASFSVYSSLPDGKQEKAEETATDELGKSARTWKEVVVNDCTHAIQKGSSEYKSGQD